MAATVDAARPQEQLVVVGGTDPEGRPVAIVHAFDVAARAWRALPPLETPRACHRAQVLDDGSVLVTGGSGTWPSPAKASCELLRPGAARWCATADLLQKRSCHGMAAVGGQVYVAGGMVDPSRAGFNIIGSCEVYDVAQRSWAVAPDLKLARFGLQLLPFQGGSCIAAIGGRGPHPRAEVSVEVLDLRRPPEWVVLARPLLFPRIDFAAVATGETEFLIVGGNRVSAEDSSRSFEVFSVADAASGAAKVDSKQPAVGSLPGSQVGCRAALLRLDQKTPVVVLAGGNATAWGGSRYGQDIREEAHNDLPVMVMDPETRRLGPAPGEFLALPDVHRQPAICAGVLCPGGAPGELIGA